VKKENKKGEIERDIMVFYQKENDFGKKEKRELLFSLYMPLTQNCSQSITLLMKRRFVW